MTSVYDMRTYNEYVYDLPAEEAVVAAYRQYELKDMNWWMPRKGLPPVKRFGSSVSCGDYSAVVKKENLK